MDKDKKIKELEEENRILKSILVAMGIYEDVVIFRNTVLSKKQIDTIYKLISESEKGKWHHIGNKELKDK